MDWQYELNKAKREGFMEGKEEGFVEGKEKGKTEERIANIRLAYQMISEMGYDSETAIQRISDRFAVRPEDVRKIITD